jgi:uncharacterized protein YbbC (DUF1343 family)
MKPALVLLTAAAAFAQSFAGSAALDALAEEAIRDGLIPGAVLVVGHEGKIVHRKAYGYKALVPDKEPATVDTIYDAASLTKVMATMPAIMKLLEQGKIRLAEPVTTYLPEFQGGKSDITVRDLLTHFSGLRGDLDLEPPWSGYETGIRKALADKPLAPPGAGFIYSDINFELLGEIVRRLSGKPLDEFAREQIFEPLGMKDTMFRPPESLRPRIAPTEIDNGTGQPWRGIVHDPTARYMGGVAGHAGLFTTADDLARYAEMWLGMGERAGVRLFSPLTIERFSTNAAPTTQPIRRGLGWDIDSPYSSNRGELYRIGGYGHTGFTGPAVWIDPGTRSFVVIMANRVHPRGGRSINPWRSRVATVVAAGLTSNAAGGNTLTGLDVLAQQDFAPLKGRRVGLITNQTGVDRSGRRNVDAMRAAGVNVVALFSPEHGIAGQEDRAEIADSTDAATGLPIRSLYGAGRTRPTAEMLRGIDTLVFDIQDAGARFYTYSCTMLYALEEAAKARLAFFVLDRPNPVGGRHVEGPVLEDELASFVGCYDMPVRHGLTMGELAQMANTERKLGADLHVIALRNWRRDQWFDETGLPWINPSPNMRSLNAALLYPGIALLEGARDYSVGRGTDAPFEQIGADWINGVELAFYLNARSLPGVRVYPVRFKPTESVFAGRTIEGVRFDVVDRDVFDSVGFGLELAHALQRLYPGKVNFEACRFLIGSRAVVETLKWGEDLADIQAFLDRSVAQFLARRNPFLLY